MKTIKTLAFFCLLLLAAVAAFIYSGVYPMGADVPHNKATYAAIKMLRDNAIERAAKHISVPPLDDPDLLLSGGADYNEMCTGCHLKPGMSASEMSQGLYPAPPNLASHQHSHSHDQENTKAEAQRQFWVIKHGIKASAMPAWGKTHSDERIWAMVAFLQKLPELTPAQYRILTTRIAAAEKE